MRRRFRRYSRVKRLSSFSWLLMSNAPLGVENAVLVGYDHGYLSITKAMSWPTGKLLEHTLTTLFRKI